MGGGGFGGVLGVGNQLAGMCCTPVRREKRKLDYFALHRNIEFDGAELMLYEPVEKLPPFSRKTLVLVSLSAFGNGKQKLIDKIVDSNPDIFATTVPLTSNPKRPDEIDGEKFWHYTYEEMLQSKNINLLTERIFPFILLLPLLHLFFYFFRSCIKRTSGLR